MEETTSPLLSLHGLTVERRELFGDSQIGLRNVSLEINRGEVLAVAGETGCGKSLLSRAIFRCLSPDTRVIRGSIFLDGRDLLSLTSKQMRDVRRKRIAFIDSDIRNQLSPSTTVEQHLWDTIELADRVNELGDEREWNTIFYEVGIVEPESVMIRKCRELSPLMIQRVMLMTAIFSGAELIVCDDPTSELDAVAETQFFEVLNQVKTERQLGVLLTLSHLSCLEKIAERACILYAGGILETGPVSEILSHPSTEYTREFFAASPHLERRRSRLSTVSGDTAADAERLIHEKASTLEASLGQDEPLHEPADEPDEGESEEAVGS